MVIAGAFSPVCENPCRVSEGGVQHVDSLIKKGAERRKRSACVVDKVAKEDERRCNDTNIGDAISSTERLGGPTEHDQAGVPDQQPRRQRIP